MPGWPFKLLFFRTLYPKNPNTLCWVWCLTRPYFLKQTLLQQHTIVFLTTKLASLQPVNPSAIWVTFPNPNMFMSCQGRGVPVYAHIDTTHDTFKLTQWLWKSLDQKDSNTACSFSMHLPHCGHATPALSAVSAPVSFSNIWYFLSSQTFLHPVPPTWNSLLQSLLTYPRYSYSHAMLQGHSMRTLAHSFVLTDSCP